MKVRMLRNLPVFGQAAPKYEGQVYAVTPAEGTELVAKLLAEEIKELPEIAAPVMEMPPVVPVAVVPPVPTASTRKRGHSVSSPMGK